MRRSAVPQANAGALLSSIKGDSSDEKKIAAVGALMTLAHGLFFQISKH